MDGRTYYSNRLKIKIKVNMLTFIDIWNNKKYDDRYPIKKWKSVKPSEMQHLDTANSIWYFVGKVERGKYCTIAESITEEFGEDVEVSYQLIDQKGVSPRVW